MVRSDYEPGCLCTILIIIFSVGVTLIWWGLTSQGNPLSNPEYKTTYPIYGTILIIIDIVICIAIGSRSK